MGNQRGTFSKRQREQNLKDKARAKQERLAARRAAAEQRTERGPPIASPDEQNTGDVGPIDNASATDPPPVE